MTLTNSFVAVRLRGIIVHRPGPSSACLVVLSDSLDLFLQSRWKGGKLCFRDVILSVPSFAESNPNRQPICHGSRKRSINGLLPYRTADVARGDASFVVNNRAPWAEFSDNDEVRDTRQCGWFVFGSEGDVTISSFVVEPSRRTWQNEKGMSIQPVASTKSIVPVTRLNMRWKPGSVPWRMGCSWSSVLSR